MCFFLIFCVNNSKRTAYTTATMRNLLKRFVGLKLQKLKDVFQMYIWKLRGRRKYRQLLENLIPLSANYARKVTVVHDTFL